MIDSPSLYLIPTPIGNLGDITLRAIEVLKSVDAVLAEDTRQTGKLLRHFEISVPMHAFHQHNEHQQVDRWVREMQAGQSIAQVSDAGSPGISDPGYLLVRKAIDANLIVTALPGASAFVPALAMSGLPCDRFIFEGFLPHKKGRQTRLKAIAAHTLTTVIYESPYRLIKLLEQLIEHCSIERQVAVCREISKIHEEAVRGSLEEVHRHFEEQGVKGEIVLILDGTS